MKPGITALLLHVRTEPLSSLKIALERQCIDSVRARSCVEALGFLHRDDAPHVIITDLTVSDGAWGDALLLAGKSPVPVNLIVVSDMPDLPLCQAAADCGAFGFIMPPLAETELRALVLQAGEDVLGRRTRKALHQPASPPRPPVRALVATTGAGDRARSRTAQ
jgi:DNA-binding NtrC family response regulator